MQNIDWRGNPIHIQSHTVKTGMQQLELRHCRLQAPSGMPRVARAAAGKSAPGNPLSKREGGPPILLVPDFLDTSDIFLPSPTRSSSDGGLAAFLASAGYEVYLAELRGKGRSWPAANSAADWSLDTLIREDIPAHLAQLAQLRPDAAPIVLGQGLGSLLLLAHYLRSNGRAAVRGMVHFSGTRRSSARDLGENLLLKTSLLYGYIAPPFDKGGRRESANVLRQWRQWRQSEDWLGEDGFDYGQALAQAQLPPSIYFAGMRAGERGNVDECRRWIAELPPHDCRLVPVGRKGGNLRDYSRRELLSHPKACDDHFLQLESWLQQITARDAEPRAA